MTPKKIRTGHLKEWKKEGRKIVMVTAHDTVSASVAQDGGADVVLVGDSLGMANLGYRDTTRVTMDEMIHHCAAASRGARKALLVGDMPFMSYKISREQALTNAARFVQEGYAEAVKIEGAIEATLITIRAIVNAGIPVMAHIGLTPQSVHALGGWKVQGKQPEQVKQLLNDAQALESAGAFSLVVEAVPEEIGRTITEAVSIPTIGIGAGRYTDGQVLVYNDLLGITKGEPFKFVKRYRNLREEMTGGISDYAAEVREGKFPSDDNVF
jgi:3-methyl-2-oxobutanoate hydroxymethyltransferase